jgi:hypothetical protein
MLEKEDRRRTDDMNDEDDLTEDILGDTDDGDEEDTDVIPDNTDDDEVI